MVRRCWALKAESKHKVLRDKLDEKYRVANKEYSNKSFIDQIFSVAAPLKIFSLGLKESLRLNSIRNDLESLFLNRKFFEELGKKKVSLKCTLNQFRIF